MKMILNDSAINHLLNDLDGPVAADLYYRTIPVFTYQKARCPVDTGLTRESTYHKLDRDERGLFAAIGTTATTPSGHPYPLNNELGTIHQPARPWIRPSLDELRSF
jgi:hypothetical protein